MMKNKMPMMIWINGNNYLVQQGNRKKKRNRIYKKLGINECINSLMQMILKQLSLELSKEEKNI
jgi:hypothetical protein